ncbi:MAG: glycosyltransferase, partial [Defluviitaleaceae bacterium]|nr:glycosyltransferase [Defluviitaleaceae bacterium]
PPPTLIDMFRIWQKGKVDVVEGEKQSRGSESLIYKFFAKTFYGLLKSWGNIDLMSSSDFQLLDRRVVDIIIKLPEKQRFFRALSTWTGFNRVRIPFKVEARLAGKSKFDFYKSYSYAVNNITSFTSAPLQIVTFTGICFLIGAIALGFHTIYQWFMHNAVEGFTTVILLLLIIGAMLMISIGILGMYVGKIYEELKHRPDYLVKEVINR